MNRLHGVMDVVYHDDLRRLRPAPANIMHHAAINVFKATKGKASKAEDNQQHEMTNTSSPLSNAPPLQAIAMVYHAARQQSHKAAGLIEIEPRVAF